MLSSAAEVETETSNTVDKEESKQIINTRLNAFGLFYNDFMLSCWK